VAWAERGLALVDELEGPSEQPGEKPTPHAEEPT
jgi:hypothetical protein